MADAPPACVSRAAAALNSTALSWRFVQGGYTPAARYIVTLNDGRTVFVKAGTTEETSAWIRSEARVYTEIRPPHAPELLGWGDGNDPYLILPDHSAAHWPPPWTTTQHETVVAALRDINALPAPPWLRPATESGLAVEYGWEAVARDPDPFLGLSICSASWLDSALPALMEASATTPIDGDHLAHMDIRSDNLCFHDGELVIIDWNLTARAAAGIDLAFWLPSLHVEGGPPPETLMPDAPGHAALTSGFFASRAGLAVIPHAPRVRWIQFEQLRAALPWAIRALGLDPADGPRAGELLPT